ncbi:MAG: amidohydrolase family protein [Solirubrobacteraceae bacterium]|nr:amidohydrolase family protein [Solirubrobacteraceae bacterium]
MAAVDTHQHLWSESLWEVLACRNEAPFVRRQGDRWTLHLAAEPACLMPGPEDPRDRASLLDRDGVDFAVVAPSTALGAEWLPREEAEELWAAHRVGVRAAGQRFRRWGSISLLDPDPADLDAELRAGAVGLCLPAGALASGHDVDRLGPVLEHLERAGAPLFIHPGPSGADVASASEARWSAEPWWWPGLTDYVATMQRAWFAWGARGRREFPELRVLFAMLGGLAPLQAERLAARGAGRLAARLIADQHTWYETSSYGPHAHAAVAAVVGDDRLVHGSDRPVVDGDLPSAVAPAHANEHAHALLGKAA